MGTIRAHSDSEIQARKDDILRSATDLLLHGDWGSLTLATVAEKTSISRPSMYNYYKVKEEIFLDLMIREYADWKADLETRLEPKLTREDFCAALVDSLWGRDLLTMLIALYSEVPQDKCRTDFVERYHSEVHQFYTWFSEVRARQFPAASEKARNGFLVQFVRYCVTFRGMIHFPEEQMELIKEFGTFGELSDTKTICFDGLMLLSAGLDGERW